jgi:DNA repair photolyase
MSVNKLHARAILKQAAQIDPDSWAEYFLDAYESKGALLFEHKQRALGVRENAVKLLNKRLASKDRLKQDLVAIGYYHEPYPEAEYRYGLTRGMIETLKSYKLPLYLQSSSLRILDDIDLLRAYSLEKRV